MFSTPEFLKWSKKNVVLLACVETQIEGREKDSWLGEYELPGFPSMLVLDASGTVLCRDVEPVMSSIRGVAQGAAKYAKLEPRVVAGDKVDPAAWFTAQLWTGRLSWSDAQAGLESAKLNTEQRQDAEPRLMGLELENLLQQLKAKSLSKDSVGDRVYASFALGRTPANGSKFEHFFYAHLVSGAVRAKDAKAFHVGYAHDKESLDRQVAMFERSPKPHSDFVKNLLEDTEHGLAKLRKQASFVEAGFKKQD